MYRSKGELCACAGIVFQFLCAQRVPQVKGGASAECVPGLSEEEARRGHYMVYGCFPSADAMTTLSASLRGASVAEQAFTQFILSQEGAQLVAPAASFATEPAERTLFSALAGPKGFITYEDLVQIDEDAALFRLGKRVAHRAHEPSIDDPGACRRRRLLLSLFRTLDTHHVGSLLLKDVACVLGPRASATNP